MPVPNLKRIALFVPKLLGGHKISKLGHMTQDGKKGFRDRFIIIPCAGRVRPPSLYRI